MTREFLDERERAELEQYKGYLDRIGLPSVVVPVSSENPVNLLSIRLVDDLNLHVIFIPIPHDQFSRLSLVQFHVSVSQGVSVSEGSLLTLVNRINERTPLGQFIVTGEAELVFRYVLAKGKVEMMDEAFFVEFLTSLVPALEAHCGKLLRFLRGELTLEAALDVEQ